MTDPSARTCQAWPIRQELQGVRASRVAILERLRSMRPQSLRYQELHGTLAALTAKQLKLETLLKSAERRA